jgi:hypothetical protein
MEMAGEREPQLISNSNRRESGPRMGSADPYCGIKLKPERRGMAERVPSKGLSLVEAGVL